MARQKLIHLHTSGTTQSKSVLTSGNYALELGEIAVQHNAEAAKIYVRLSDAQGAASDNIAEFIDATAVEAKITSALSETLTDVSNLETIVGDGIQGKSLTQAINDANDDIAAEVSARTAADTALGGRIDGVVSDLADETSARTAADNAINAKIGGDFDSTDTVAAAISQLNTDVAAVSGDVATEAQERQDADDAIMELLGDGLTTANTVAERLETVEAAIGIDGGEDSISDRVEALETGLANEVSARTDADSTHTAGIAQNVTDIAAINTKLGSGFSSESTVASQLAAVKGTADTALQSISKGTDGNYVTTTIGTKANNDQSVGVAVTVVDVSAATGTTKGLAEASDVKTYVDGKDTAITQRVSSLETDNTTIKGQLSGLSTDSGSVKKYVDDQVAAQVAAAYKVKGTVADYAALTAKTSTAVVGDVWNMTASATVDDKVYPAGTNWVYTEQGWDALGGTVDLSPFMQTATFETWTAGTYTTDKQNLENSVTAEGTNRATADTEIKAIIGAAYTTANTVQAAIEAISDSSSDISEALSAETTARENADTALSNLIGTGFDSGSSATTVAGKVQAAQSKANQNADDIDALEAALGNGFSQSSTVASQLDAVKTTADGAVQSVSVKNTATNLITATEDGTTHNVELDFDNMVIDCGSY